MPCPGRSEDGFQVGGSRREAELCASKSGIGNKTTGVAFATQTDGSQARPRILGELPLPLDPPVPPTIGTARCREPGVEVTATRPRGWRFQARYSDGAFCAVARNGGQPYPRRGSDPVYACDPRSPRGTQAGKFCRRFLSARAGLSSGRKSHPEMGEVPAVHLRCCYADRHQRRPHDARRRRPGQVLTRPAL